MASEDIEELSAVSSSIFYAIRNTPENQKLLLNNIIVQTDKRALATSSEQLSDIDEKAKEILPIRKKKVMKILPLFNFYSEIPPSKEDKPPFKKKKREKTISPTRQFLSTALQETKKHLSPQQETPPSKQRTISKKERKIRERKKIYDQTIKLNQFIAKKKVELKPVKRKDIKLQETSSTQANLGVVLGDEDPFPFTNLSEWLIWHHNYPELAFVREVYDPEQIPDKGDIEVFWVNIMNDPEFFNPEWRIAGSRIDIDTIKQHKRPDWVPEWDILSSYTDGFSIFLEDVYQLLSNYPKGLKNYRYPVLQFALKGLFLLDLVHNDNERWFKKGKREDLSRLIKLDQFITEQDSLSTYQRLLNSDEMKNEWYLGLVCFDLIIIRSSFLKQFSQNQLTEDEKIEVLKEGDLNQIIGKKLSTIEKLERINVKNLKKKLGVG
ncbi:MAG: hypothetical protein JSW11_16855 [Candidatus Heimdallarchaeota archaeon]|nr:MAG: hypothetical protein JSW11_16855 [Candidatus Heimdallarchaeota archaeon]